MNVSKAAKDVDKTQTIPKSSLFDKLDAFLPQMQHANEELQQKIALDGAEKYSLDLQDSEREIESGLCDTESKPTVEMNFALGVMGNDSYLEGGNLSDSDGEDEQKSPQINLIGNKDAHIPSMRLEKQACPHNPLIKEIN